MVDFSLALILTVGTALAGLFLPGALSDCNDASNWNNATDGRNFFVAANATGHFGDPETTTPTSICKSLTTSWIMAIVVMHVMIPPLIHGGGGLLTVEQNILLHLWHCYREECVARRVRDEKGLCRDAPVGHR